MKRTGGILCLLLALAMTLSMVGIAAAQKNVILATTTSTQDSGLLDVLLPIFEKKMGVTVKVISVGTGQALAVPGEHGAVIGQRERPAFERHLARLDMLQIGG